MNVSPAAQEIYTQATVQAELESLTATLAEHAHSQGIATKSFDLRFDVMGSALILDQQVDADADAALDYWGSLEDDLARFHASLPTTQDMRAISEMYIIVSWH